MILPTLEGLLESPRELQPIEMPVSHLPRVCFWDEGWAFKFLTDPLNDSNVPTGLGTSGIEPLLCPISVK